MYKTNYFENVDLSFINGELSTLLSNTNKLRDESSNICSMFMNATEWEGNSKDTLNKGFRDIEKGIDAINSGLSNFVRAIGIAQKIVKLQKSMEGSSDVTSLISNATSIEQYLNEFKSCVVTVKEELGTVFESSTSNRSYQGSDGFGSGVFRINKEKFDIVKDSFNKDWSALIMDDYDRYLALETYLSSDDYLHYMWAVLVQDYDKVMEKRDNINNWTEEFSTNIKTIENSLPEAVASITSVATTAYAKSHNVPSEPSFDNYKKSGRKSEIKQSSGGEKSSSSTGGGSSYSGGNGGSRTTSPGGNKGSSKSSSNYQEAIKKAKDRSEKQKQKTNYQNAVDKANRQANKTQAQTNYQNAIKKANKQANKSNYQKAVEKASKQSTTKRSTTAKPTTTARKTTTKKQSALQKFFLGIGGKGPNFPGGVAGGNG